MEYIISSIFFFQAEDGIRDPLVTGVQTCALPIFEAEPPRLEEARRHLDIAEEKLGEASSPGDLAYLLSERGRLALMEGKPEDALALTERALVEAASDNLERGRCLFLQGRAL